MLPTLHIDELSLTTHFAPSEVRHMMPVYKPSIIQNLFCIMKYYVSHGYPKSIIPVPDPSLKLMVETISPYYHDYQVIWHENFDDEGEHLKNTLGLGAALVNYVYGEDQVQPSEIKEKNITQNQYIKRVDIIECKQGTAHRCTSKYSKQESQQNGKNILSYNFIAQEGKIYAIFARNYRSQDNAALASSILRKWNLKRLNIDQIGNEIEVEQLDKTCEHLYTITRGFIREVNDDYNVYRANLRNFIHLIENTEMHEVQILDALNNVKLNSMKLPSVAKTITYHITFRRSLTQYQLFRIVTEAITQWILQTPLNISCSYASSLVYEENTHNFILTLSIFYQESEQHFPHQNQLNKSSSHIQSLMLDQSINQKAQQAPTQQNILENSMQLLSRYQPQENNNQNKLKNNNRSSNNSFEKNSSSSSIVLMNESKISQGRSQSPSKINMKRIAKIENQIYEILKLLEANNPILTPDEIEKQIRKHLINLDKKYNKKVGYGMLKDQQCQAMEALAAINETTNVEQIYLLLKSHPNDMGILLEAFLQKPTYEKAITLGKLIGRDHLQTLYKKSIENGLSTSRHSLIIYFLKKMILQYSLCCKCSPMKVDEISVPELIEIMEQKKYDSHYYSSILSIIFPQLFPMKECEDAIKVISPILSLYLEYLLRQDHHYELVYSFIGDLLYEVCYFTHELKINMLSNTMYYEEKYEKSLTIKEKKIMMMIREGGFRGFGFEIKNSLLEIIDRHKNYMYPDPLVYNVYEINKPGDLLKFFKTLTNSHHTENLIKIARFLQKNNCFSHHLSASTPLIAFFLIQKEKDCDLFQEKDTKNGNDPSQFNSISERILKSESGIFQDMVRLNPKVKIAGIQLNTAMKNLSDSRVSSRTEKKRGQINIEEAIPWLITADYRKNYEYIELALYLKDKYENYHTLSENQKSYFRNCADDIIDKKRTVMEYVMLSSRVKKENNIQ